MKYEDFEVKDIKEFLWAGEEDRRMFQKIEKRGRIPAKVKAVAVILYFNGLSFREENLCLCGYKNVVERFFRHIKHRFIKFLL